MYVNIVALPESKLPNMLRNLSKSSSDNGALNCLQIKIGTCMVHPESWGPNCLSLSPFLLHV